MRRLNYDAKCKVCGCKALYRSTGLSQNIRTCKEHLHVIKDAELNNKSSDHMSEADHITWGKL